VFAITAMAQDMDPLAVLKSEAPLLDKIEACRALVLTGTPEAIPVLAPLLLDEKLAHMARYALEPMPYPEAGAALRDALGKTSGLLKVGVISSLATRKDAEAVPELRKLVTNQDAEVALAAAKALGDIATPEAAEALLGPISRSVRPQRDYTPVHDALLACAGSFAAGGNRDEARAIYDRLLKMSDAQDHVRAAAFRGVALTQGGVEGAQMVLDALAGDDEALAAAALRIARELDSEDATTTALANGLATLSDARKILLLAVFGPGDAAAGPAALAEAEKGGAEVRVAAIQAVTRIGYEAALPAIEAAATSEDAALAEAARNALSYFPDNKGDAAITAMLSSDQPQTRRVAIELIGVGALVDPIAPLMQVAMNDADEGVRVAALEALQGSAGVDELAPLLESFITTGSPAQIEATRAVLAAISERQKRMPGGVVVTKAVYGDLPDGTSADVTEQVKQLVASGALTVDASNANFGDTAPGAVKHLRIDYTENGSPGSKTVREGETLKLAVVSAPPVVVDAFMGAYEKAAGDAKLALIRLLGSTGSQKAFDAVQAAYASDDATVKDVALRTLCEWPSPIALPALMELVAAGDPNVKLLALRGAVRLIGDNPTEPTKQVADYAALLKNATTPEEKMAVLGGISQMKDKEALDLAFAQIGDAAVQGEAVQAAINIARNFGATATDAAGFFNGTDLAGWVGTTPYWKVQDGAIVGTSDAQIPNNEFLWSGVEVGDFYLVVDVRLEPNTANAGIQIRSKKISDAGQAQGYQADVGEGYWGRIYHEHGREMLDDTDTAEKAVKPGDWNHYEILAVGPAIWTAINGTLGAALLDLNPNAERNGQIAFQLHSGAPMTAQYRVVKLVHNPKVEMEGMKVEDLIAKLRVSEK
jgi:HEAT repeat protein